MSIAAYPRPTGEIESKVVDQLWVELSELLVQQWADRFKDVRGFELACSHTLGTNSKLLVDVFTGDGGYAAQDALDRRKQDYANNSDASEQDRAHAQKLADDIRDTKIKMAQVANTVKIRVDAIRFRGKLQNKPANVIDAEVNDQIAQGRKACKELADQLRDSAKTIASGSDDSGNADSEDGGDVSSRSRKPVVEKHLAPEPSTPQSEADGPDVARRGGSEAVAKSQPRSDEQEAKPASQEQSVQSAPSSSPASQSSVKQGGESHATAQGTAAPAAATHVSSAAPVDHAPPPSAHAAPIQQQPAERPGFFSAPAPFSRPSQPQPRSSSQTTAQSGAQAAAQPQPAQEQQHREDHLVGHEQAQQQQASWSDGGATTSAMGAAALAPPPAGHMGWSAPVTSLESRTGFSASSFGYQGESGHTLGHDGVLGSTDGNREYLAWAAAAVGATAARCRIGGVEFAAVVYYQPETGVNGLSTMLCSNFGLAYLPPDVVPPQAVGVMYAPETEFSDWPSCLPCAAQTASVWFEELERSTHFGWEPPRLLALVSTVPVPPVLEQWAWQRGGQAVVARRGGWDQFRQGAFSPTRLAAVAPQLAGALRTLPPEPAKELGFEVAEWAARSTRLADRDEYVGGKIVPWFKKRKKLPADVFEALGSVAQRHDSMWIAQAAALPPAPGSEGQGWDDRAVPPLMRVLDRPVPLGAQMEFGRARAALALRAAFAAPGHPDALADVIYEAWCATSDWKSVVQRVNARLSGRGTTW